MTHFGSKLTEAFRHPGITAALPPGLRQAVKAAAERDACHPSDQLSKVLDADAYADLAGWIIEQTAGEGRAPRERRHAMYHAAFELACCGVPTAAMNTYAIRQILDLAFLDLRCDHVRQISRSYAAIHVLATGDAGPATGGILRVVRDNL